VLPFANMSADPEQQYFCDGISEDIINALARVRNIRIVARTSAFAFKGQNVDIRTIGEKLEVNHVLEGSVRRAASRIRVTAQLVEVERGSHLWSERFDRELDDIFAIQDEISLAIVKALEVELAGGDRAALVKRATDDRDVHSLYLLGRHHWQRLTEEGARKARQYFEEALELDPAYAPAYAGLAAIPFSGWNTEPPHVSVPRSRQWAARALELDPSNGDAHCALALSCVFHERKWSEALQHCLEALEADPNASWPHQCHAFYLSAAGRHDEAIAAIERAVRLDPISPLVLENAAFHCYCARRVDGARAYLERCFSLEPDFPWGHLVAGLVDAHAAGAQAAIPSFERAQGLGAPYLAWALGVVGRRDGARATLDGIEAGIASGIDSTYNAAIVHLGLGDVDRCLDCLEDSTKETPAIALLSAWMGVDPFWDALRDHPRFRKVTNIMSFPG